MTHFRDDIPAASSAFKTDQFKSGKCTGRIEEAEATSDTGIVAIAPAPRADG